MAKLDEFALIEQLFAPLTRGYKGALDLKDDAALITCPPGRKLVVTADAIIASVHFLADDPPDLIARKVVRVNLSDLAAMGAKPEALLLAACFPKASTRRWLERFAAGLKEDLDHFGVALVGGDTCVTPGPATFAITAMGTVAKGREMRRSRARPDDRIWVSGSIGDAAFGLLVAQGAKGLRRSDAAALLDRYRLPQPRLALGQALAKVAHAAIDVSDGLAADLGHICETSGVAAIVAADSIPLSPAVKAALAAGWGKGINTALSGGDDYELLFTAPRSADRRIKAIGRRLGLPLTPIGRMLKGSGVTIVADDGRKVGLPNRGYRHFEP